MNKLFKKAVCFAVTVVLVGGVISGCGSSKKPTGGEEITTTAEPSSSAAPTEQQEPKADISKRVELQFYQVGGAPADLDEITDKLNELTLRDLNCTVKFNFSTWTDWSTKYKLLLTSGQKVDLVFTSDWTQYNQYAKKGAFQALDTLVPQYAPELYNFISKEYWDGVKVDGKIYTIPATWKEYVSNGVLYREDLRKKYNLPELDSLENIEKYMETIKQNMLEQQITLPRGTDFTEILTIKYPRISSSVPYGLAINYDTPRTVEQYWGSADFTEDMKMFKRWADAGYWSKSALASKDVLSTAFNEGKYVLGYNGFNANKYADAISKVKTEHPDWEIGWKPYGEVTGVIVPVHPIHNGVAVPLASENPERAIMFYEKLVLDKEYNYLTEYGIEGKHYTIKDGYYEPLIDPAKSGFPREGMSGWAWRNPEIQLFEKSFDSVNKIFEEFDKISKPDLWTGFAEDITAYQAEKAALDTVITTYLVPLMAGQVADVDKGIELFMDKAKEAGLDKIQEEFTKQWLAYCEEKGIE